MKPTNPEIDFTTSRTDFYKCSLCGKIEPMNQRESKHSPDRGLIYCPVCKTGTIFDLYMQNN